MDRGGARGTIDWGRRAGGGARFLRWRLSRGDEQEGNLGWLRGDRTGLVLSSDLACERYFGPGQSSSDT
jgi:hypothetical protein